MESSESTLRDDLAGFVGDIDSLERVFGGWNPEQRSAVDAYRRAIEALHAEAVRRLVKSLKSNPVAVAALKEAVTDEVVYAVLRRLAVLKPSLSERIETALSGIRPLLAAHGGDVELVSVEPPAIEVRFLGACDGCPASALTFHEGVKKAVEEACPEITEIRQVKGSRHAASGSDLISPFALNRGGEWHFASDFLAIPDGGIRALVIAGNKVILSRRGSLVTCFQNACAHLGLTLDEGEVDNGVLTCPHHGFQYDLGSGECLTAPTVQLLPHAVRLVGSRVEVRLAK